MLDVSYIVHDLTLQDHGVDQQYVGMLACSKKLHIFLKMTDKKKQRERSGGGRGKELKSTK